MDIREVIAEAQKARERGGETNNPKVGAALLTKDGILFTGCNVYMPENPSLSTCAERVAIWNAVSQGHREFDQMVVVADAETLKHRPCGACRQVMTELAEKSFKVILVDLAGNQVTRELSDLLPDNFIRTR